MPDPTPPSSPDATSGAFAETLLGDAATTPAPVGLEYRRLKAQTRELLFGAVADPVRIGRFTVLRRIGEGGMGVVYSAYDDELERKVAIKLVRPQLETDDAQRRIRREAQAAARLSHPNVITVYEIGEHGGRLFVAMEFVRGQTLRQWLCAAARPWQSIVDVYLEAAHGLQAAHAAGLVHRDFKPDNVMIDDERTGTRTHGRVRVLDFGVARRVVGTASGEPTATGTALTDGTPQTLPGAADASIPITQAGGLVGTPAFMAPEQLAGTLADARSDQYAFCLSLWLALFDASPFEDDSPEHRAASRERGPVRPPPASAVPSRVRRVLERGLAPKPDDRHRSMDEVIAGLAAARRRPWRWAAAIAATAATVGVAAMWSSDASECERDATQLDAVWSRDVQTRLAHAFEPSTWSELAPEITTYVDAWRRAHASACETNGDEALQQRRCLAAGADDVRALVASLDARADDALTTVRSWPAPGLCLEAEPLRQWSERQALIDAPPPVGSADGWISDFEGEPVVRFGFGWVRSTDEMVEGSSDVTLSIADVGAHGSAHSLGLTGTVRPNEGPMWAGAMFFPGMQAMSPANLSSMPLLSFSVRGTPGEYSVVLFTQTKDWDGATIDFEVGDAWQEVRVDLRGYGAPLYDVTGIFIGRSDPGAFSCNVDDVRLEAVPSE